MKPLENKVAIIYGHGAIGSAIAKAFVEAGARVHLTGRSEEKLETIARAIRKNGGVIETSQVDALDEKAVEEHISEVIEKAGRIDISFNAIGIPMTGIQGTSLMKLSKDTFLQPVVTYLQSHFITAKVAANQMAKQGNGVLLMHTPNSSRTSNPFVGGMTPTWAAMEALCRSFSVECAPLGIRAVCLLTTGIPETPLIDEVWGIHGKSHGLSFEQFNTVMQEGTHRKRLTTLEELSNASVFAASDAGSGITGTVLNLTAGMVLN